MLQRSSSHKYVAILHQAHLLRKCQCLPAPRSKPIPQFEVNATAPYGVRLTPKLAATILGMQIVAVAVWAVLAARGLAMDAQAGEGI